MNVTISDYNRYLVSALEETDKERALLIEKFNTLATAQQEMGDLRGELQQRTTELERIQREVSDHRVMVQEEREKNARLVNENAVLQAQVDDDRAKIASLLTLCRQELRIEKDYPLQVIVKPTAGAKKALVASELSGNSISSLSLRHLVDSYSRPATAAGANVSSQRAAPMEGPAFSHQLSGALDVPPGSALVPTLSKEVETLRTLLEEQRRSYDHDRALRLAEEHSRFEVMQSEMSKQSKTIERLQELLNSSTKEACTVRHESLLLERKLRGELETLSAQAEAAADALAREHSRRTADLQVATDEANVKAKEVLSKVRSTMLERSEAEKLERVKAEKNIEMLEQQIESLQSALQKERTAKQRMAKKHRLESEGLQSDIALLKQQLRQLERRIFFAHALSTEPSGMPDDEVPNVDEQ